MRWIWVDNNRNDMNSEHILHQLNNEIIGLFTQEAYGSTSERILLGYGFSFHSPKPWLFFWISPHQNCTQTSRHQRNPPGLWFAFQDLWEHVWRRNIRTLNYSSGSITKGNNYININNFNDILRNDERRKAEYWIAYTVPLVSETNEGEGQKVKGIFSKNFTHVITWRMVSFPVYRLNGHTLAHDPNCCQVWLFGKWLNGHIYDCHWRLLMVLVAEQYINNIDVCGP